MAEALAITPIFVEAVASSPAAANPAVLRCCQAYTHALEAALARGKSRVFASLDADSAYRNAMPPLTGSENIRNFIACVAHAMLIGAVRSADGARLLYAAQVAFSTLQTGV